MKDFNIFPGKRKEKISREKGEPPFGHLSFVRRGATSISDLGLRIADCGFEEDDPEKYF
jgi:hypothetical protein